MEVPLHVLWFSQQTAMVMEVFYKCQVMEVKLPKPLEKQHNVPVTSWPCDIFQIMAVMTIQSFSEPLACWLLQSHRKWGMKFISSWKYSIVSGSLKIHSCRFNLVCRQSSLMSCFLTGGKLVVTLSGYFLLQLNTTSSLIRRKISFWF